MTTPLKAIAHLRLSGRVEEAFNLFIESKEKLGYTTKSVTELARLSMLLNQLPHVENCYDLLIPKLPDLSKHELAPLWRLSTIIEPSTGFEALQKATENITNHWEWYDSHLKTGREETYRVHILGCKVLPVDCTEFKFKLQCPCCQTISAYRIQQSLCVLKHFYCPHCFAHACLDYEMIEEFWKRHPITQDDTLSQQLRTDLVTMLNHTFSSDENDLSYLEAALWYDMPKFFTAMLQQSLR